jgi:predicted Zn-dependent protease with MMP-like domain
MSLPLLSIAEQVIFETLQALPPELVKACADLPVLLHERPAPHEVARGIEPDTMGLFCGTSWGEALSADPLSAPRITLYLLNIWEFSGQEEAGFREEVRVTLLHELGHYLGWDEEDVALRGLN